MAVAIDGQIYCWGKYMPTPTSVKQFLPFEKMFTSSLTSTVFATNYRNELFAISRSFKTQKVYALPENRDIRISVGGGHLMVMMSLKQVPWLKNTRNYNDVQIVCH